nr:zincin-like metallopeptidase domain-containing protein [Bradyrhizobium vignae]
MVHGGSRACYIPSTDNIHMPCIDFFQDAISYYATLAHLTRAFVLRGLGPPLEAGLELFKLERKRLRIVLAPFRDRMLVVPNILGGP